MSYLSSIVDRSSGEASGAVLQPNLGPLLWGVDAILNDPFENVIEQPVAPYSLDPFPIMPPDQARDVPPSNWSFIPKLKPEKAPLIQKITEEPKIFQALEPDTRPMPKEQQLSLEPAIKPPSSKKQESSSVHSTEKLQKPLASELPPRERLVFPKKSPEIPFISTEDFKPLKKTRTEPAELIENKQESKADQQRLEVRKKQPQKVPEIKDRQKKLAPKTQAPRILAQTPKVKEKKLSIGSITVELIAPNKASTVTQVQHIYQSNNTSTKTFESSNLRYGKRFGLGQI